MRKSSTLLNKEIAMRIEIMLDKSHKISQPVLDAFHAEVNRRVVALFPDAVVRARQRQEGLTSKLMRRGSD